MRAPVVDKSSTTPRIEVNPYSTATMAVTLFLGAIRLSIARASPLLEGSVFLTWTGVSSYKRLCGPNAGGTKLGPGLCGLERRGGTEHAGVIEAASDDLQTHR
jgi:hypothetical protein